MQRPDGTLVEIPPERCPAGHPLLPRGTLVGWSPCDCTPSVHGHRTYTCRHLVDGTECGSLGKPVMLRRGQRHGLPIPNQVIAQNMGSIQRPDGTLVEIPFRLRIGG